MAGLYLKKKLLAILNTPLFHVLSALAVACFLMERKLIFFSFFGLEPTYSSQAFFIAFLFFWVAVGGRSVAREPKFRSLLFILLFALCVQDPAFVAVTILLALSVFGFEKYLPEFPACNRLLLLVGGGLLYLPLAVHLRLPSTSSAFSFMLLLKVAVALRIFSWLVFRRLYFRKEWGSIWEFLEYFFCPVFFTFPSTIHFFLYQNFHGCKQTRPDHFQNSLLALWGLFLLSLFYAASQYIGNAWLYAAILNSSPGPAWIGYGAIFIVFVYLHHAGCMSLQVSLARFLGYNFRYDMNYPFLSRSPFDYYRRHSNYVREYMIEVAYRPMALFFLRKGWGKKWAEAAAAILSYSALIIPQTGPRPYNHFRSPSITVGLILVFMAFVITPYAYSWFLNLFRRGARSPQGIFELPNAAGPLRHWAARDYLQWAGTMVVLSLSKLFIFFSAVWKPT